METIYPFNLKDDTFRTILNYYDNLIPIKELSGFATPDLSSRIFIATDGLIKHVHDLITGSAIIAFEAGAERITMPMLSKAYIKFFNDKLDLNPFAPEKDYRSIQELLKRKEKTNQGY